MNYLYLCFVLVLCGGCANQTTTVCPKDCELGYYSSTGKYMCEVPKQVRDPEADYRSF